MQFIYEMFKVLKKLVNVIFISLFPGDNHSELSDLYINWKSDFHINWC